MSRDDDFAAYVNGRWTTLVHSALLLGCSGHEAEDMVQSALARCYVAWPRVAGADQPDAYVYRVLVNTIRDSKRRRWWGERPTSLLPEAAIAGDPMSDVDEADLIARALADLSSDHRAVVVLRFFAHLSERDTASVLGIAVGTVKSRTARALAQLATNDHLTETQDGTA